MEIALWQWLKMPWLLWKLNKNEDISQWSRIWNAKERKDCWIWWQADDWKCCLKKQCSWWHYNLRSKYKKAVKINWNVTRGWSLLGSSRLFRKKNPQEGQEKSNSIINILCTVTPRKVKNSLTDFIKSTSSVSSINFIITFWQEMSHKDLQTIENIKWDPPYDPANGWKKSSINVKNYGRMIHSSKVRFRFLHCQVSGAK